MSNGKDKVAFPTSTQKPLFLLVEPPDKVNSGEIARKIAGCGGVKEVHLTTGDYGFVVSARVAQQNIWQMRSRIKRASGSRVVKMAVSHLVYR